MPSHIEYNETRISQKCVPDVIARQIKILANKAPSYMTMDMSSVTTHEICTYSLAIEIITSIGFKMGKTSVTTVYKAKVYEYDGIDVDIEAPKTAPETIFSCSVTNTQSF